MVRIAVIFPLEYYPQLSSYNDIEMGLAHLVLSHDNYKNYLKKKKTEGKFVILDNSNYELGRPVSYKELTKAIELINPDEVVAPDCMGNAKVTVQTTLKFCDYISKINRSIRIQAVIHGRTLREALWSYTRFVSDSRISTIGVPFGLRLRYKFIKRLDRTGFLSYLKIKELIVENKSYHCLGLNNLTEMRSINSLGFIRSVDTSLPCVYGINGITYSLNKKCIKPKRLDNYFFYRFSDKELRCTLDNIRFLRRLGE